MDSGSKNSGLALCWKQKIKKKKHLTEMEKMAPPEHISHTYNPVKTIKKGSG